MVARIKTGKNMLGALNYNENKVREGKAECLAENMFGTAVNHLTFTSKRKRFDDQIRLNRISKTNVVHISLNFAVGENLEKEKLKQIAAEYMQRIGFGDQPYLVYNHFDAAHPHLHILSTSIQSNGKRIPLHNLGRIQSEKARTEIEILFALEKANGRKEKDLFTDIRDVEPAKYGKAETKAAISRIVMAVTRSYKYTSLPELNAVLKQFNVVADRGKEDSQMFKKHGLAYSILDSKGNKVGVPIKASAINGKPTLKNLEKQFNLNRALRASHKTRLQLVLDTALKKERVTVSGFVSALQKENVVPVFRQSDDGRVYGITFVDHHARVVFNGSDLGKEYAAKALMERLQAPVPPTAKPASTPQPPSDESVSNSIRASRDTGLVSDILKDLMETEKTGQSLEPSLVRKRRKKRRRRSL